MQIASKLYKTKIDANPIVVEHQVDPLIQDSKVTRNITITLIDFNNNPVLQQQMITELLPLHTLYVSIGLNTVLILCIIILMIMV